MRPAAYRLALGSIGSLAKIFGLRKPTIFCFHSVTGANDVDESASALSVSVDYLRHLINDLRAQDVPILSLEDAVARIENGQEDPFVVLTFDDGYRDNYTNLFPLMLELQVPFTIFLTTGLIDRTIPMWWDAIERMQVANSGNGGTVTGSVSDDAAVPLGELTEKFRKLDAPGQRALLKNVARAPFQNLDRDAYENALTWPMIREMVSTGLLTVGAHTQHHPMLSRLAPEEVRAELAGARDRIKEQLGVNVHFTAYPYGQPYEVGDDAKNIAREVGYTAAFSTVARPLSRGDKHRIFELPRVLLAKKAQRSSIAMAYMSGLPATLNRLINRGNGLSQ